MLSRACLSTLPLLLSHLSLAFAAPSTGDISLWTDSSCLPGDSPSFSLPDPIALNHTLPADSCYTLPNAAHSYIVSSRPTCSNGKTAGFAYYSGENCRVSGFGSNNDGEGASIDGVCLALVEFNSCAFICNGVDNKGDGKSTATITVLGSGGTGVASVVTSTMGGSTTAENKPVSSPSATPATSLVESKNTATSSPSTSAPSRSIPSPSPPSGNNSTRTEGAVGTGGGYILPTPTPTPNPNPSPFVASSSARRISGEISIFIVGVAGFTSTLILFNRLG
ncbi:MAG: hypothetical protein Q9218_002604 [Villophora microphyllina]